MTVIQKQKTAPDAADIKSGNTGNPRGQASNFSAYTSQQFTAFLVDSRDCLGKEQIVTLENMSAGDLNTLASIVSKNPSVRLVADIGNKSGEEACKK